MQIIKHFIRTYGYNGYSRSLKDPIIYGVVVSEPATVEFETV